MSKSSGQVHEDFTREYRDRPSSDRVFGLVFATMFALIGFLPALSARAPRLWAIVVGVGFLLLALMFPGVLGPLNRLWSKLGVALHRVVSPIVIALLFFGAVTPMAVILRILGKDPLRLKRDPTATTYWIERVPPGPSPESIKDQF
jgi:Saxitoxin biosynthesis operon protein SxtJ